MGTLGTILLAWIGLSIPVGLIAGRFLASNSKHYPLVQSIEGMSLNEEQPVERRA